MGRVGKGFGVSSVGRVGSHNFGVGLAWAQNFLAYGFSVGQFLAWVI